MRPDDQVRLRHLREAAAKAIDFSKGRQRHDLDDDELLRLALTKLVEIVGEAAKSISLECRPEMPQVSWRVAGRMRDHLVRHYLDILWQTSGGRPGPGLPPLQFGRTRRSHELGDE